MSSSSSFAAAAQGKENTSTLDNVNHNDSAAGNGDVAVVNDDDDGPEGCYLTYENDSGGKLMLFYSRGEIPDNAVGFWAAGEGCSIQSFKFKQAGGRSELIKGIAGGDANRRKYYVGWCQFIKLAKAKKGIVIKFPHPDQGVEVDAYGYKQDTKQPYRLELDNGLVPVAEFDAVAVLPKHKDTFEGVKSMAISQFLEKGNVAGATTLLV